LHRPDRGIVSGIQPGTMQGIPSCTRQSRVNVRRVLARCSSSVCAINAAHCTCPENVGFVLMLFVPAGARSCDEHVNTLAGEGVVLIA
jgi:hypothetical protein